MKKRSGHLHIHITPEMHEALAGRAWIKGITIKELMRDLIKRYLEAGK
jgi:predicted HicB family RNase H-like nuclease